MSEKAPFMVFSGTNSRYLAEKICASLDCPLGNMNIEITEEIGYLLGLPMANLRFHTRSQFVAHMYSWFNPLSLTQTT